MNQNKELIVSLLTYSSSKYLIPTENQILEALFEPSKFDIEPLKCANITLEGNPKILYPLITNIGNFQAIFEIRSQLTSEALDIQKLGLANSVSACVISLKNHKNAETPVKINISGGRVEVSFPIITLGDLLKLVIKLSDKIIYSKVLMIYEKSNAPLGIAKEKPDQTKIFASLDPGLMLSNGKLHKKISTFNKRFDKFKGNYSLYIFKV